MTADRPLVPPPLQHQPDGAADVPEPVLPRVSSRQLLMGGKELLIEHRGAWYRLRETALGKLILTK